MTGQELFGMADDLQGELTCIKDLFALVAANFEQEHPSDTVMVNAMNYLHQILSDYAERYNKLVLDLGERIIV